MFLGKRKVLPLDNIEVTVICTAVFTHEVYTFYTALSSTTLQTTATTTQRDFIAHYKIIRDMAE